MAYNLLRCERDQSYLMPPSMSEVDPGFRTGS